MNKKEREELIFAKGEAYESLRSHSFSRLTMGWLLVIISPIWFFFSVWSFNERFYGGLVMLVFGLICLYVGYDAKKRMEKLK